MKNFLYVFMLAFIPMLISCDKEHGNVTSCDVDSYDQIGVNHNACLVEILNVLKNSPKTKSGNLKLSKSEVDELVCTTTVNFVKTKYSIDESYVPLLETTVKDNLIVTDKPIMNMVEDCSEDERDLYVELDLIMSDDDIDLTSLHTRVDNVTQKSRTILSGTALDDFLAAASVAKNTLEYWHNNFTDWTVTLNAPVTKASFNWKQLGKADVTSCIGTVMGEGVAYLIGCGPVGWKAWLGIAVSGAVAGSVSNALDQLW